MIAWGDKISFTEFVAYINAQYKYDWCEAIYIQRFGENNEQYGTYMVRRDEEGGKTYINADGGTRPPEYNSWANPILDSD